LWQTCKHLTEFPHPMNSPICKWDASPFTNGGCVMADPLPTNTEIPKFDTYPARSASEDISASPRSRTYMPGTSGSTGAVPGYNDLPARSALEERAAQVGGAVGRAVATVRRGRGKLVVMKSRTRDTVSTRNLSSKADE